MYRLAVTTKRPGGGWQSRFLSPIDKMAFGEDLAVNAAGDVVVSFIQGYNLADMTVRAATKVHGPAARGSSQRCQRRATRSAPGAPVTLTGDQATSGSSNSEQLGLDAASRGLLVYTQGDYPDTESAWRARSSRGTPPARTWS